MILKVVDLNFLVEQDSKVAKSTRSVIAAISAKNPAENPAEIPL